MENDANYALVGALFIAVILALFGFVYWFAGPASTAAIKPYDVVFTGAVSGIDRGTQVQFNGIRVGQVKSVNLDPNDTDHVIARIEVDTTTPVKADTKVVMGFQGLTGIGSIQLTGGTQGAGEPPTAPGHTVPTLFAENSNFQSILNGATATLNNANSAAQRLNDFLVANDAKLSTTVDNIERFSSALSANSEGLNTFLSSISDAGREIGPLAQELRGLSGDLRALVAAVPADQVSKVVTDVSTVADSLARNSAKIDDFFASTTTISNNLTDATTQLKSIVASAGQVTKQIDPEAVGRIVTNLDTFSTKLGENSDNLGTLVANATTLTNTLNHSATQVDGLLTDNAGKIGELFTNTSTISANLADTTTQLKSIVASADQVSKQLDPVAVGRIVANLDNFSTQLGNNSDNINTLVTNATMLTNTLNHSATQVDGILTENSDKIDDFFNATSTLSDSITEITTELKSVIATADQVTKQIDPEAVGRIVTNVDTFSAKLGENSDNVDTVMANVTKLTDQLNQSASKVDGILSHIDGMVSGANDQDLFAQLSAAAKSVHQLADQLNQSAVGLNDFTSRGLPNYSALAVEARATLDRLDRVVRNLEANPQSLVFGGQTVRDYDKK